MNQKTLVGLVVAALVAIVVAIVLNRVNRPVSEANETASAYLAPQLHGHVDAVSKVVLTGAGDKIVATLERGAGGWGVAEKGGYPVDTGTLRGLLLKLADARLIEKKTAMKDNYSILGVADVSNKDAKGTQVEIDGLGEPLKIIIGDAAPRDGGTFVRRAGDAQSWLASGNLALAKTAADWLKKELVDIPPKDIMDVAITRPDGNPVHVQKDARSDANFKLADVPKGREPASEYSVNALASALSDLHLEDVLPGKDATPPDKPLTARYETFDGMVIEVTGWKNDDKEHADFNASLNAVQADKGIAEDQAKAKADYEAASAKATASKDSKAVDPAIKPLAVSDPAKDHADRLAELNKRVADLNDRFNGWTFILPPYKYAAMDKSMDDLLKPLEKKKPAAEKEKSGRKPGKSRP